MGLIECLMGWDWSLQYLTRYPSPTGCTRQSCAGIICALVGAMTGVFAISLMASMSCAMYDVVRLLDFDSGF